MKIDVSEPTGSDKPWTPLCRLLVHEERLWAPLFSSGADSSIDTEASLPEFTAKYDTDLIRHQYRAFASVSVDQEAFS